MSLGSRRLQGGRAAFLRVPSNFRASHGLGSGNIQARGASRETHNQAFNGAARRQGSKSASQRPKSQGNTCILRNILLVTQCFGHRPCSVVQLSATTRISRHGSPTPVQASLHRAPIVARQVQDSHIRRRRRQLSWAWRLHGGLLHHAWNRPVPAWKSCESQYRDFW